MIEFKGMPAGSGRTAVKGGSSFAGKSFEQSRTALLFHAARMKTAYLLEV